MASSRRASDRRRDGQRLRRLRETLGLTQRELAAEFRVANGALASWESGTRAVPGPALKLLEIYESELGLAETNAAFSEFKASVAGRALPVPRRSGNIIARTAAGLLGRMLTDVMPPGVVRTQARLALVRGVAQTLGDLKGLAMKAGQMVAYVDFGLSEAARAELGTLLAAARPMSALAVAQVFLEEHGKLPRELFAEWSPVPFAAASIGQVHRARLRSGEEVAVKVQYPRIAQALEADLRNASALGRIGGLLFRAQAPGELLEEVRERTLEECDYRVEAEHQEAFRRCWRDCQGLRIPRIYPQFSSRRILVSELCQGESLESQVTSATPASLDHAGSLLFRFAAESLFQHGYFHADPHPGNLLFAEGELVVLDFGCVKRFTPPYLASVRATLRAYLERDFGAARRLMLEGEVVPDPRGYDFDFHHRMVLRSYEYLLGEEPFHFSPEWVKETLRFCAFENVGQSRMRMPRHFLFATRLLVGLVALLARLRARVDCRSVVLDALYAPGDPRPAPFTAAELQALR